MNNLKNFWLVSQNLNEYEKYKSMNFIIIQKFDKKWGPY